MRSIDEPFEVSQDAPLTTELDDTVFITKIKTPELYARLGDQGMRNVLIALQEAEQLNNKPKGKKRIN